MRDTRREAVLFELARRRRSVEVMRRYCQSLDFDPDPWQLEFLTASEKRLALLCGRQFGKSTVTALRAALTAVNGPRGDVILASRSARQSQELFRKCIEFITHPSAKMPRIISESAMRLELATGVRIIALPAAPASVRGFSAVKAVVVDEAAFVPGEVFTAVSPMLAVSSGDLVVCSTAWTQEGFFYNAIETNPDFRRWIKPSTENPRITAEFLEQERRAMGEEQYRCEYECQWLPVGAYSVFDPELVDQAVKDWQPILDWKAFRWDLAEK